MKAADRHHPAEDQLIALYFGDGDAPEEQRRVRQHVHGCETCTWRYAELVAPLERLRADAASEADEIFTPARLEAQKVAIRERLEQGVRASRVIPFPTGAARMDRVVTSRPMFRWIAAAAAAGLLVGVTASRFIGLDRAPGLRGVPRIAALVSQPETQPKPTAATYQRDAAEEALLSQVETALTRHRIAALSALDDFTPHAREAVMASR